MEPNATRLLFIIKMVSIRIAMRCDANSDLSRKPIRKQVSTNSSIQSIYSFPMVNKMQQSIRSLRMNRKRFQIQTNQKNKLDAFFFSLSTFFKLLTISLEKIKEVRIFPLFHLNKKWRRKSIFVGGYRITGVIWRTNARYSIRSNAQFIKYSTDVHQLRWHLLEYDSIFYVASQFFNASAFEFAERSNKHNLGKCSWYDEYSIATVLLLLFFDLFRQQNV